MSFSVKFCILIIDILEKIIKKLYNQHNGDGMMKKKKHGNRFLTFVICIFVICISVISSFNNISKITEKQKEKKELTKKLENLKQEEKTLSDDVDKLKNKEYAARYAREKYLYSKNGEKVLKID